MAISRLTGQDAKGLGATGTASATYAATPTQGNLLVATAFSNSASDALAISGFTKAASHQRGTSQTIALFYKLAGAGESTTVTVTGGNTTTRIHIYEYTGNANPVALDGTNQGVGTNGTSWLSPSVSTTNTSDLVFIAMASSIIITGPSFDSSFNLRQADASIRLFDADRIVSSTGSYSSTASWTTNSVTQGVIVAFKAATITGGATVSGTGSLTGTGTHTGIGAATVAGAGALTATGTRTAIATATLTGAGTLAATGSRTAIGAATLTGSGTVSATGTRTVLAGATLTGTGGLTATGIVEGVDGAVLSGSGSLSASGARTTSGGGLLTGTGALTASGTVTHFGVAALPGTGNVTATGSRITYATALLIGAGGLTATATSSTQVSYGQLPDRYSPPNAVVGIAAASPATIGITRPPGRFEP